jgi:hypothetical protein
MRHGIHFWLYKACGNLMRHGIHFCLYKALQEVKGGMHRRKINFWLVKSLKGSRNYVTNRCCKMEKQQTQKNEIKNK